MRAVGKTWRSAIAKWQAYRPCPLVDLTKLKGMGISPISGDYKAWRRKFFRERLYLASKIACLWILASSFFICFTQNIGEICG